MNKLFVFQNIQNDYLKELEYGYDIVSHKSTNTKQINIDALTVDCLIDNEIDVIVSNGLSKEWYLILKGLKIVSITIDELDRCQKLADIVIDYKSEKSNKYFTGIEYSLSNNRNYEIEFDEITDLMKKLNWDSTFWNFHVFYLSCKHLSEAIIYRIDKVIKYENIRLIEYLCNCHDKKSVRIAEQNNFQFTDIRLSFEKKLNTKNNVDLRENIRFGLASSSDIKILENFAGTLYDNSRYYFDENFSKKKVVQFYQGWIRKAVLGQFDDACYCLYDKNIPIGFGTVRYDLADSANIGLVGISRKYQGDRLGQKLLYLIFNKLIDKKCSKVFVVTQGRNYAAQRLYQNVGFLTKETELWYHKWI